MEDKKIKDLVHVIRGQQVMLDSDLAQLYGTEVKNLNRQVKRNFEKFPEDFMFQLEKDELNGLWCQIGTANISAMSRTNPYVFTEQGIYMVATILKNDIATQQSIYIMRSFKEMKHYLVENKLLLNHTELSNIYNRLDKHDSDIEKIMDKFIDETDIKEKLFLDGQIFDAVEAYIQIYKQANQSIYIIDNYINIKTLGLLKNKPKNIEAIIFTNNKGEDKLRKLDVESFNKQFPNLILKYSNKIHDRFIIIDYGTTNEKFYVCGSSSKDAGKKICTIIQLHDRGKMHLILEELLKSKDYVF